jgi:hypothetical protein
MLEFESSVNGNFLARCDMEFLEHFHVLLSGKNLLHCLNSFFGLFGSSNVSLDDVFLCGFNNLCLQSYCFSLTIVTCASSSMFLVCHYLFNDNLLHSLLGVLDRMDFLLLLGDLFIDLGDGLLALKNDFRILNGSLSSSSTFTGCARKLLNDQFGHSFLYNSVCFLL